MSTPTSQDAVEVAQVLNDKLKPIRVFIFGVLGLLGAGAVRVYDLGVFIEKTKAHEDLQDINLLRLGKILDEHEKEGHKIHDEHEKEGHKVHELSDRKIIEIFVNDLALLRTVQLETLPKSRRVHVKQQFEIQRINEIKLLAGRQGD